MKLNKSQLYTVVGFIFFLILVLGMRTKPTELLDREKNRSLNLQSTDVNILKQEALSTLSDNDKSRIQILETQLASTEDKDRIELFKNLSAAWYSAEEIGIAGYYAEQVALNLNSAESWGIAGTTYALCVKRSSKEKERSLCLDKSLESLESAISLDPENLDYQINRAVLLAEHPPAQNPMQGIQLLLGMNKNFPKNVSVINNIAKFALQTRQYEKAEQRLLGALELEPDNITTNCLLAQLYLDKGDNNKSSVYQQKCGQR